METNLITICAREFNEVAKDKIPSKELKALLRYYPLDRRGKVEVSDKTGFCKEYDSMMEAIKDCGKSDSSTIKYAIDHNRPSLKSKLDEKKFRGEKFANK